MIQRQKKIFDLAGRKQTHFNEHQKQSFIFYLFLSLNKQQLENS